MDASNSGLFALTYGGMTTGMLAWDTSALWKKL